MKNKFTDAQIETVRDMAADGFGGVAIARAVGCSPGSVRALCARRLDIKLRRGKPSSGYRFQLSDKIARDLALAAAARSMSPGRLAMMLLELIVRDDMIETVLDAPLPVKPAKAKPAAPAPIAASITVRSSYDVAPFAPIH